jgi:hypothetical protein
MSFETVEEMKRKTNKINQVIKQQKHIDFKKSSDMYKLKSIDIESPPLELEFMIPMDDILVS